MDKNEIRKVMKKRRLLMERETFLLHSQKIIEKVQQHDSYKKAKTIGIYVSLPGEVDTIPLIQQALKTHRVCVPKVIKDEMEFYYIRSLNDLKEGIFHVLEPITHELADAKDIDLMIVPMLAFDNQNYRVGYGKGFYDKYFAKDYNGYKLGLAFLYQKVHQIDIDIYDLPLDEILSE